MRYILKSLIVLTLFLTSTLEAANAQNYYRYGSVNSDLNKRAIVEIAKHEIRRLVIKKKIPESWKLAELITAKKISKSNSDDWIVSYHNKKIKNAKGQNLYIFVDTRGNVVGVNYTGK